MGLNAVDRLCLLSRQLVLKAKQIYLNWTDGPAKSISLTFQKQTDWDKYHKPLRKNKF
jgi:hypothetical protein